MGKNFFKKEMPSLYVHDIMMQTSLTIHRKKPVCEVEGLFIADNIGGAALVDDIGNLVGIITKVDMVRHEFTGNDPSYTKAWEIATPKVITIKPSASIEEAARIMLDENVHHLVVIGESKRVVGMVSAFDFVKIAVKGNSLGHKNKIRVDDYISIEISSRKDTKSRLEAARAKGKLLGRPKGSKGKTKLDGKEEFIKSELKYKVAKSAIARKLEVSRGSLVNFINSRGINSD
jgi:CBS domain-containing protein